MKTYIFSPCFVRVGIMILILALVTSRTSADTVKSDHHLLNRKRNISYHTYKYNYRTGILVDGSIPATSPNQYADNNLTVTPSLNPPKNSVLSPYWNNVDVISKVIPTPAPSPLIISKKKELTPAKKFKYDKKGAYRQPKKTDTLLEPPLSPPALKEVTEKAENVADTRQPSPHLPMLHEVRKLDDSGHNRDVVQTVTSVPNTRFTLSTNSVNEISNDLFAYYTESDFGDDDIFPQAKNDTQLYYLFDDYIYYQSENINDDDTHYLDTENMTETSNSYDDDQLHINAEHTELDDKSLIDVTGVDTSVTKDQQVNPTHDLYYGYGDDLFLDYTNNDFEENNLLFPTTQPFSDHTKETSLQNPNIHHDVDESSSIIDNIYYKYYEETNNNPQSSDYGTQNSSEVDVSLSSNSTTSFSKTTESNHASTHFGAGSNDIGVDDIVVDTVKLKAKRTGSAKQRKHSNSFSTSKKMYRSKGGRSTKSQYYNYPSSPYYSNHEDISTYYNEKDLDDLFFYYDSTKSTSNINGDKQQLSNRSHSRVRKRRYRSNDTTKNDDTERSYTSGNRVRKSRYNSSYEVQYESKTNRNKNSKSSKSWKGGNSPLRVNQNVRSPFDDDHEDDFIYYDDGSKYPSTAMSKSNDESIRSVKKRKNRSKKGG